MSDAWLNAQEALKKDSGPTLGLLLFLGCLILYRDVDLTFCGGRSRLMIGAFGDDGMSRGDAT